MTRTCHVILMLLIAGCVSAQRVIESKSVLEGIERNHFGYVSGSVGYSSLSGSLPNSSFRGGLGATIGLGYEYQIFGAWINAGVQMSFHNATVAPNDEVFDYPGFDTQSKPTTFHYAVNQTDALNYQSIELPILLGYTTHDVHFGVGVKFGYVINAKTTTKGSYTLSGTNDEYGITFRDMPEHGYTTYPVHTTQKQRIPFDVSLIGEVGYNVLSFMEYYTNMRQELKVSAYFEYGLTSILSNNHTPNHRLDLLKPTEDATKATLNPYLSTFSPANRVVPFMVGVKFTYMLGITKQ